MFTGIIETIGKVVDKKEHAGNIDFEIKSNISNELRINQSVSHNGVCLTVIDIKSDNHIVTVINETIKKSALAEINIGDYVNIERSMPVNGRFDGHIVLGHVDQTGICRSIVEENGSFIFTFAYESGSGNITVEKGSICVNGISLTVINSKKLEFSVAVIPYTYKHTNLEYIKINNKVNLEFDIIGKYLKRIIEE